MHLGLRLHQRVVDPLEDRVVAGGEGIVLRLLDRVVGVAPRAVDVRDRVADRARDAGLARSGCSRRRNSGRRTRPRRTAPGRGSPRTSGRRCVVAVAFERDLARLADARQVRLVVERAEVVRRVEPALVRVLVALQAVVVHHQRLGRDELAVGRHRRRREEVLLPLLRSLHAERPRVLRVQQAPSPATNAATTPPNRRAHSQRIRGPASRCLT